MLESLQIQTAENEFWYVYWSTNQLQNRKFHIDKNDLILRFR